MPWTAGGLPVVIDMLFGHVKLGTSPSATAANPVFMNRATFGTTPSLTPRSKYAGSPPSMQTTTTGRDGHRYRTQFSSMPSRAMRALPAISYSHYQANRLLDYLRWCSYARQE